VAAKSFKPPVEEEEGHEEEESSEEEEVPKGKKLTGVKSRAKEEAKPQLKTKGKKQAQMDEEEIEEQEEEEDYAESTKGRKTKLNTGKAAKAVSKPTVYKKGKWNPNVVLVEKCQQLESESAVPNFECSARNSNREVIRAAMTGNKKLFEKIIKSDKKISRLTERWGVDNNITALKILIEKGDTDFLATFLELLTDTKKTVSYGPDNVVYLQKIDTGFNNKYAYGVATRRVALSRGGRQGNNAFVEDQGYQNAFDDEHIEFVLSSKKTTVETIKLITSFMPHIENQFISKIGVAMRYGNVHLAAYLLERTIKNGGYGLSEFFVPALTGKSEKAVKDIKKPNCTKKAFGMGNITPIHCACLNPNAEVLKHILTVNPEYGNIDDQTRKPVHYAACCPSPEPLRFLVSQNVDTRDHDNMRTTPLMYACRAGQIENVKFLLQENRSIIAAKDRYGYSAIHYAAENGHQQIVKLLIEAGVKIAVGGPDRKTALHITAAKGDLASVKFLLENGAKVTAKDKFKRTPLLLACKNGNLAVASYLLQQGSTYDEADSSGNSPLHYACAYGYPEVIGALLQAGANPNSVNSWNLSPTAVALLKSYFSCLRRMLDDPLTNVNCIDDEGRTLISNAIKTINAQNFNHVAFLLRDKKADPNIPDAKGLTAFDYLCAHNVDALAQAEVKSDMNLEEINTLKAEKRSLYKKYFTLFLESHADINHKDQDGVTSIFRAISNKNVDVLHSLLDMPNLELNIVSEDGQTVFHYLQHLVFCDDFYVIFDKIMKKCGHSTEALLNKYANNGFTPIHSIFSLFVQNVDTLKSQYITQMQNDLKLSKKPRSDEIKPENDEENDGPMGSKKPNIYPGLMGGARVKMTSRMAGFGGPRKKMAIAAGGLNANAEGIVLTSEEIEQINQEAENKAKDKVAEFFEGFKLATTKGLDANSKVKKPIKKKVPVAEGEEEEQDTDAAYDIFDYFDFYCKKLQRAVESKIDLPEKEKVPENVGYTLLHIAGGCVSLPAYKFLIEDALVNINQQSVHGESELLKFVNTVVSTAETASILDYLISKRLSTELKNLKIVCPLLLAVEKNKEEFVRTLLRHKAHVNSQDINGRYPLLQAVKNKNLQIVEILLANKADPNLRDELERNSIHWAINLSNADADASNEIENCLLSSGGDLNAVDARGRTPLHYAFVKIGDPFNNSNIDPIETVSNIIARPGVKVDIKDTWGNTALSYAAQRGAVISALYLLKNHADIDNINEDGNTPLNICLLNGHQNMCIFLVQKNCKLSVDIQVKTMEQKKAELERQKQEKKKKPIQNELDQDDDFAEEAPAAADIEFSSSESEDEPVSEDEEIDEEEEEEDQIQTNQFGFGKRLAPRKVAQFGGFGYNQFGGMHQQQEVKDDLQFGKKEKTCTTFSVAIRRNWQSVAFLMLEFGFDLSLAIIDCFAHKKYNYVYTLLLKKAEAGVYQTTNATGQNLTHLFAQNSSKISEDLYTKILNKLDSKGLDFGSADTLGRTSLHYASEAGCIKLVTSLLERGLDINQEDAGNVTPLGHILLGSFGNVIKFASLGKEHGLDLNKRFSFNNKQHTALTYITEKKKRFDDFVKLHEMGANINLGDSDGWTPLIHYIRQNNLVSVASLLQTFKIDTKVVDREGKTIVHHAVQQRTYGSYENIELLEFVIKHADINKPDNEGHTPLYYAKRQLSGRLAKVLEKHNAKDLEISESAIRRVQTSVLNELDFPLHKFDFEEDFEKFIEHCKKDSQERKKIIDERVPVDKRAVGNYEVSYDGEDAYDCYMVKVDITHGYFSGNTFYKMQILREKVRDIYIVFTRWGRVGTDGQFQQTPFSTVEDARKEFCSIFKAKSGNLWEDRHNFIKSQRKYRLVPFASKTKFENYIKAFNFKDSRLPRTELPKEIFALMRRLCNYKIITNALNQQYRFNSEEVPIHSLTRERLADAQAILDAISKALTSYEEVRKKRELNQIFDLAEELSKLTSEFYELIPTTSYKTESIPPVTNQWTLNNLQKMMHDLFYFEIAIKLVGAATFNIPKINPVDYCYNCIDMKMITLTKDSEEFKLLK
jgi:ankyrin repeat protein/predicted DNA-binding WGR domain protein